MLLENIPHAFGIIFNNTFSYKLKVFLMYGNPFLKEDLLGDFLIYNPIVTVFIAFEKKEQVGLDGQEINSISWKKTD